MRGVYTTVPPVATRASDVVRARAGDDERAVRDAGEGDAAADLRPTPQTLNPIDRGSPPSGRSLVKFQICRPRT
jgi:hypothetical protein